MSQIEASVIEQVLAGGGEMGALMRTMAWSKTPLGPVAQWPQSLRTAVSVCLSSRFPILIWWGPEFVKLYNDAYRPILGLTKHPAALGQRGRDCWPEIWHIIGPMLEGVFYQGEATWSDDQMLPLDRNGYIEECYFTFSYSPIQDETGGVGGIFTAVTETTARVLSERRLQTLRELGERASEGKTAEDACRIAAETLAHNPADVPFALLYLLDAEERQAFLVGTAGVEPNTVATPSLINITSSGADTAPWPLAQVAQTGQAVLVENLSIRFNSLHSGPWPEAPHTALVLPIAAQGQAHLAGFLVVGVSSRRALDDDYQGFFELIAGHITTAIANARAYEAERRRAEALAELDRAKTAFFSNISHEFRTPLTLLLGPLEDALTGAFGPLLPEQRDGLELAQRNALRLLKLVNTLLDFSRIEASRIEASFQPTDLATFTADLASVFRSATERAGLRLVVDCPPLPEPVYVDRDIWEKIVLNLLSNAFKFTHEGEIVLTLRALPDQIELTVADTGTGIPADELPHIFQRFYRVRDVRGRTQEGSGIGLALVQELIHLHGGQIGVVSEEGAGTTFTVQIPRGTAHLPPEQVEAQPTLTSTALGPKPFVEEVLRWLPDAVEPALVETRPVAPAELPDVAALPPAAALRAPEARILLIEDNADMRKYLYRLLSVYWTVEAVADGAAALTAAREREPDLVLTDVMIPGLDGFELLRELRADSRTQAIPTILLSARAGEEAIIEGLKAGADDYLTKPFSARELVARVGAHLEIARIRREAAQRSQELHAESELVKERLERILEGINDHFVMYDHAWRYVYVNDEAAQMLGYPKEQLIGQCIWDLFPGAVGNLFYQKVHQAVAEQQEIVFEHYYQPWDLWVENRAYPIQGGLLLFATNITERKKMEQAVRESEERYRSLAQATTSIVWVADANRAFVSPQPAWETYTGQTWEEYQGWGWLNALYPDDRDRVKAGWRQAIERRRVVYEVSERLWHAPSGMYRYVIARGTPVFNPDGTIREWIGTMTDSHEHKQAEELIHFQASLLDQIQNAVVVHDLEGKIIYWNNFAERLYGWKAEEAQGQDIFQLIAPSVDRQRFAETARILEQSGQRESEFIALRKDGTTLPVFVTESVVRDATSKVIAFVGVSVDITARKREEAAQRLLAEAGSVLASSLDYKIILHRVARLTLPNLGDFCLVYLLDEDRQIQQIAEAHVDSAQEELLHELGQLYQPDFGNPKSYVGQVVQTGQSVMAASVTREAILEIVPDNQRLRHLLRALDPRSILALPLQARGHVLGTIVLAFSGSERRYGADEMALAEELARRVALALDNARLYEAEQKARTEAEVRQQRLAFLAEASQVLGSSLDYETTLTSIAQLAIPSLADWCTVHVIQEDETVRQLAVAHVDPAKVELAYELERRFPPNWDLPAGLPKVLRTGQPELMPEVTDAMLEAAANNIEHLQIARELSIKSVMVVPLKARGQTLGAITFVSSESGRHYNLEDLALAEELARRAALAIDNTRLYAAEQEAHFEAESAQEYLVFLAEASRILVASLDYETTLQRVARLALPLLADYCIVHLVEENGQIRPVAEAHVDPHQAGLLRELSRRYQPSADDPRSIIGTALRTQEPVLIPALTEAVPDTLSQDEKLWGLLHQLGSRSIMILPLLAHNQMLGALTLVWAESDRRYSEVDLSLAEELTRRAALAVDNARLFRQAQRLNMELEHRVLQRTAELEATNRILKNEIAERQRSHARFVTIFHNSPVPISVSTWAEGRLLDVNDSFLEWLGYQREEIIGRTSSELGFQTDAEFRPKILETLQDQGVLRNLEKSYYTKSRQLRQAIVSTEKIELEDEACLLTVFYDVTEREQMAAELAEIQHRLVESLERERIHLAQELHDGPVQDLYGVSFGLSRLKEALSNEADLAQFTVVQTSIQQVIQTLRATFSELRPPALAPYGLEKAILSHAEQFQHRHPELKLALKLMPDGQELPERMRMALFRIYREAVNNIIRHAQAQQVWIEFSLDTAQAVLEVKDDGRGFEVPQRWLELARQGHLGLVGIAERVEAMGGQLQIISALGNGTLIRVSVPRSEV